MRTIESPGVEIREIDLSFNTELPVGTTVFCVGYAAQGPTDELINITSISEFEQIYGQPTNAAERYFYQTCKQTLQANGSLLVTRMPYGSGGGEGYSTNYSALVFPVFPYNTDVTEYATGISTTAFESTLVDDITGGYVQSGIVSLYGLNSATNYTGFDEGDFELVFGVTDSTSVSSASATFMLVDGALSANDSDDFAATWTLLDSDSDQYKWTVRRVDGGTMTIDSLSAGYVTVAATVSAATAATCPRYTQSENFYVGQPSHTVITEDVYQQWKQGGINWKNGVVPSGFTGTNLTDLSGIGYAGMIVVNELKSTIEDNFGGYYIALADNSKIDKGSNFDCIMEAKTINDSTGDAEWLTLNTDRLAFALTGTYRQSQGNISEVVETIPGWEFGQTGAGGYTDSLIFSQFKLRPSLYNAEDRILDKVVSETYVGSFDSTRTVNNPRGGSPLNFYLQDVINDESSTMQVFVNPNISERSGLWFDGQTGLPTKKIRVASDAKPNTNENGVPLDENPINPAEPHGKAKVMFDLTGASSYLSNGDNLYGTGEYVGCAVSDAKWIGDVPQKLERALRLVENREQIRVDLVPEAGLGTIWTGMVLDMNNWPAAANNSYGFVRDAEIFDDTVYINGILNAHTFDADSDGLLSQATGSAAEAGDLYETIYGIFNTFCQNTRQDCLHIADPLRYIFVQGPGDTKVMDDKKLNFSQHIYWPLKNLYGAANSSYACTYANWFKNYDPWAGKFVWSPPSGWVTRNMIQTDTNFFPWYAPAGLTRGILSDIVDIGINPSQKQRDLLYKSSLNPTVYWPNDGYVIWGQKTLQKKPSAFDRINVRRLFLWLEKATLALTRYFVFEQNTVFTRNRLKAAIEPVFEFAKNNEGVYDYLIVCDERNNTPDVIDRNELVVDIYIKPVRVAEFILVNFIATRTGQDFQELI